MWATIWRLIRAHPAKIVSAIASVFIALLTAEISVPSSQYVASLVQARISDASKHMRLPGSHSLSIVLKCNADPSKACLEVDSLAFPGVTEPQVSPAEIVGKTAKLDEVSGGRYYQYKVARCLKGGETLRIDVFTNGKVELKHLSLKNVQGRELIGTTFACSTSENFENLMHSCEEKIRLMDRLLAVLKVFKTA